MSAKAVESGYRGRFAPSPTGWLHAGSLAAALASWLDARAQGGRWLVRIEDLDAPRRVAGADTAILSQLSACGLVPDEPPVWQSTRAALYEAALVQLNAAGLTYPCGCSRADIQATLARRGQVRDRHTELVYPGTCRNGLNGRPGLAIRLRVSADACEIAWHDRRLGEQCQDVAQAVGDFVLRRADGPWSYQLAAVVDDAAQGITDIVRGEDLADSTARQIYLQRRLGLPTPSHLHTPLVLGSDGAKLSKGNGAQPIDCAAPLDALRAAGRAIGVESDAGDVGMWLAQATTQWGLLWPRHCTPGRT